MNSCKRNIIIILTLFYSLFLFSQNNVVVKYTCIESLGQPNANLKAYNAGLYISATQALFVTRIDSLENGGKRISKAIKTKDGGMMSVSSFSDKHGFYTITNRKNDSIYCNTEFNSKFYYKEEKPKINWTITEDTKKIENIEVQKATTHFRGRDYIAWFTTKIPIALGPWKLNGLPGLIIEAYDTNKELLFLFKKLEIPYKKPINFPELNKQWNSFSNFKTEQDECIERNIKYARSMFSKFDTKSPKNEEENLRKNLFFELFKKNK